MCLSNRVLHSAVYSVVTVSLVRVLFPSVLHILSSVVNMTELFGETFHILWQCVPYALETVAIIHQPVIYSHRQNHALEHAHKMQTNKCNTIYWGQD